MLRITTYLSSTFFLNIFNFLSTNFAHIDYAAILFKFAVDFFSDIITNSMNPSETTTKKRFSNYFAASLLNCLDPGIILDIF